MAGKRKTQTAGDLPEKKSKKSKKNKQKNEAKENEPAKASKPEDNFTSIEFCKMLQDKVLVTKGLQKFCQACKQHKEYSLNHDIIKAYISVSPECYEVFKIIETGKTSPMVTSLVFEVFVNVLLRTAGDLSPTFGSVGTTICRRILQGHTRELYGTLSTKNPPKFRAPALRVLTAMVMQGAECAADVASNFDLSGNITLLSKTRKDDSKNKLKPESNIRLCFIRFVLSFFMTGDQKTIRQVLEARGFVDSVFRGLPEDSASVIQLFLTTLLENVVKNKAVPKTNKVKLLASHGVLTSVAKLFQWNGIMDVKVDEEDRNSFVRNLAYEFLYQSCCPFKHGINFYDREYGTSGRSSNHVLHKFLVDLKVTGSNDQAHTLVVEILRSCPDLLSTYLMSADLSFDPRPTKKWYDNIALVERIYEAQPKVPPPVTDAAKLRSTSTLQKFSTEKLVAMTTQGILPVCFKRSTLKSAIQHTETDVQKHGLKILLSSLLRLQNTLSYITENSNWIKSVYSQSDRDQFKLELLEAITKQLPDIGSITSTWQQSLKNETLTDVQGKLLHVLSMYQQNLPTTFEHCSFDFTRLLHGVHSTAASGGSLKHCIEILYSSVQKYKWFRKGDFKKTSFSQLLSIILNQLTNQKAEDLKQDFSLAVDLAIKVSISNDLFLPCHGEELCTWVWQASLATDNNNDNMTFLLNYIDDSAANVAKRPHRYAEQISSADSCRDDSSKQNSESANIEVDETFWDNIPDVHIDSVDVWRLEHSVGMDMCEDKCIVVQASINTTQSRSETDVSLFLAAMIEHLAFLDDAVTEKQLNVLDSYMSSVLDNLLLLQIFTNHRERSCVVIRNLLFKVDLIRFPNLLKLHAILQEESSILMRNLDSGVKSNQQELRNWFGQVIKCSKKSKISKIKFLLDCENFVGGVKSSSNQLQICRVTIGFAGILECLVELLKSGSKEVWKPSVAQLCDFLFDALCQLVGNDCEDVNGNTAKIVNGSTGENVNGNTGENVNGITGENVNGNIGENINGNTEEKTTGNTYELYLQMAEKIFKVLFPYFLPKENNNCLWFALNERISSEISFCCEKSVAKTNFLDPYFENLVETLANQQNYDDSEISTQNLLKCFSQLKPYLKTKDLAKILSKHVKNFKNQKNKENFLEVICGAMGVLLTKIDSAPNPKPPLTQDTIYGVYDVIPTLYPTNPLPGLLVQFLEHFPSYAILAGSEILTWCCGVCAAHSTHLLKILVKHNAELKMLFLKSLLDKKLAMTLQKIEVLVSVLPNVDEKLKDSVLKKVKKFCWETLVHEVMETSEIEEYKVKMIIQLLECGNLSEKELELFNEKIAKFIQIKNFENRWQTIKTYLQACSKLKDEKETTEQRKQISGMLTKFAVQCLKSSDSKSEIVSSLINTLSDACLQNEQHCLEISNENWSSLVKACLKYHFSDPNILEFLAKCLPCISTFDINAESVFQMLTSHSLFLDTLLRDDEKDIKLKLVQLLHKLVENCNKTILKEQDYSYLFPAYKGTLSLTDQHLLQIMFLYEAKGISMASHKPFLFGNTALESYQAQKNVSETLYKKPTPNRILACIDSEVMNKTLEEFPIRRRIITHKSDSYPVFHTPSSDVYDPCFFLLVLRNFLSPENLVDCRAFLQQGALGYLYLCLSSHCDVTRNVAAGCIVRYYQHAEGQRFSEKNLTLYLIERVQNAMKIKDGKISKISTIMGVYLGRITKLMFQPSEHIYSCIHRYLLVKPELDLTAIPDFYSLFCSSELEYKIERAWILDLIIAGMRDMGDFHTLERRQLLRILQTFYSSPTSDNYTRRQVMQVIKKCCKIRAAVLELVNNQGLLPWLLGIALEQRSFSSLDGGLDASKRQNATSQIADVIMTMWETLSPCDESANNYDSGVQKDLMSHVSVRVTRQVLTICFDLLVNLYQLSGATESNFRQIELNSDTQCSIEKILTTQIRCFEYLKNSRNSTNQSEGNLNSNIMDQSESAIPKLIRSMVTDQRAQLLHHIGQLLHHNKSKFSIKAAELIFNWTTNQTYFVTESDVHVITWSFKTMFMKISTVENSVKQLSAAIKWLKQWLSHSKTTDAKFSDSMRSLLLLGYDIAFSMVPKFNTEDLLKELTKCAYILLDLKSEQDPNLTQENSSNMIGHHSARKQLFIKSSEVCE
uniref:nucleolar pre-ribosomal-associated protein 1 isoform X2 n=1 Tax=Ciona intestinalis TaxID=7719 RepID=UPI00089DD40B|nr:nucleolar pre-ribosomal-associated protein 1 isoform X2 [Ciona intestinalis]|eukprot:XP_018667840.1 nucleolar pre-ribosomal-associated protein 1 isoform X2 [Ciona intestinalis]